jgi:leucyl aminopeptidase
VKIKIISNHSELTGDIIVPLTPAMSPFHKNALLQSVTEGIQERFLGDLESGKGELQISYTQNGRIFILGMGDKLTFSSWYSAFRNFSRKHGNKFSKNVTLCLDFPGENHDELAEAAVNGLITGSYESGILKTGNQSRENGNAFGKPETILNLFTNFTGQNSLMEVCRHGQIIAETQKRVMELINIPSNRKSPDFLVRWATESARAYGYEVEVYDLERIRKEGMSALEAVNRGSENPAVFLILRYSPDMMSGLSGNDKREDYADEGSKESGSPAKAGFEEDAPGLQDSSLIIGLVGKGVLYDTGGLSIKPTSSMQYMKCDMSGAATVMGTVEAAARLKLPVSLIATIPVTDNLIDARSIKPGDVIGSYSGKTIEIIDTDAEGRLVLADALSWIVKNSSPKHIVDVATLTGDAVRSLGVHAAALFSNDDNLAAHLTDAGNSCGERLWQLPLWDEYLDELNSDVADIRNLGTKPVGGAITAAKFLEQFTGDHPSWAHLDVAGTAFGDTEFGKQKNATGFGIRLLVTFIEDSVSRD